MGNVSDIKPWFREDLARTLGSIYFASVSARGQAQGLPVQGDYMVGFAAALSAVALAVGVNPESFLAPEDVQKLRMVQR
jgi:hypothetical protein